MPINTGSSLKYPNKPLIPKDPRRVLPTPRRDCPECGSSFDLHEKVSEREAIDKVTYRIDYWCSYCDTYVGTDIDYGGPIPVETPHGTEQH